MKEITKEKAEAYFRTEEDPAPTEAGEKVLLISWLLGMDHVNTNLELADTAPPPIPFTEAIQFFKTRIPVTKDEWNALEPKLRFRAFTLAQLNSYDAIEKVRGKLIGALEQGQDLSGLWPELKAEGESPWYWETVYRTNIQTAYSAGKRMQIDKDKPDAIEIMVIDDDRTTAICRPLSGLVLLRNHPFWGRNWPPFHFNCRTSVRAIYKSMKEDWARVSNPPLGDLDKQFRPQKGFGGNPLEKESYWKLTKDMALRAAHFSLFNDIEALAKKSGLLNFNLDLVDGESLRKLEGTNYFAHMAKNAEPKQKEIAAAKKLEENGHHVFFTPEANLKKTKNPDAIIDGRLADFKKLESSKRDKIGDRIFEADKQGASLICLQAPDTPQYTKAEAVKKITETLKKTILIDTVLLIWKETIETIKK
jgi:SPP1 gp7 family putative phage head morphogenesis protein